MHGCRRREPPTWLRAEGLSPKVGKEKEEDVRLGRGRDARIRRWIKFVSVEHAVALCRAHGIMESKMNLTRLESKKQWLGEEAARFYERPLGLRDAYVEYLEWSQAREQKENQELKKENHRSC
jgi:hypothetical protein